MPYFPRFVVAVAICVLSAAAFAQKTDPKTTATAPSSTGPATTAPAEQPHVKSAADLAFEPIGRAVNIVYKSLSGKGGLGPEDRPIISKLRDQAAEFSKQFPDDPRGTATDLVLSTWLKDDQRVDALYGEMLKKNPEKIKVRIAWAERLKLQGRLNDAINVLKSDAVDPTKDPDAVTLLADCLLADNQFKEAVDALNSIPQETIESRLEIKVQLEGDEGKKKQYEKCIGLWAQEQSLKQQEDAANDLPRVVLTTARGSITLELFENQCPNTVANFISLIEKGFYNGTKFYQVYAGTMDLGGDPNTKAGATGPVGQGNPGYYIADEATQDDHRSNFAGSLGMYRRDTPNTAGCLFYLTQVPIPQFNGKYTVFGRVIDGMDVVRTTKMDDVIDSITVARKREHEYVPQTLPLASATQPSSATRPAASAPATAPAPATDDAQPTGGGSGGGAGDSPQ